MDFILKEVNRLSY